MIALLGRQITPAVPATAQQIPVSPTAVSAVQIIVLVASMVGAFLAYKSKEGSETFSWSAASVVGFSGCATYLAMYSGYIPESFFSAASTNALTAGVLAVLVSGLAGAVLVEGFRKILSGFQQVKGGGGLPPP